MEIKDLIIPILIFSFYFIFLKKYQFLNDGISDSEHKNFLENNHKPILIGGIYLYTIILLFMNNHSIILKIIFGLIFVLGILSDKNILPSPKLRLYFQIILLFCLVFFGNLKIENLSLEILNTFLANGLFNILFTVFCLAVLINGSNFIDGLNCLLSGYYILVILSIFFISFNFNNIDLLQNEILRLFLFSLMVFFIFNILGLVYLGDSGSYLVSAFIGVYLIQLILKNNLLSPYYVALILWYPAFENLFSLIRRSFKKKEVSTADNLHLHQLLYLYLKSLKIIDIKKLNSMTGIIILIFNIPSFLVASFFPFYSINLIIMIMINIFIYLLSYYFFSKHSIDKK
tara:strand:+ start:3385 stop:4416 length:1032 start_codon:yes stop_codon:yes gene_type:complete